MNMNVAGRVCGSLKATCLNTHVDCGNPRNMWSRLHRNPTLIELYRSIRGTPIARQTAVYDAGEPLRTFYGWTGYWESYLLRDSVDVIFYR